MKATITAGALVLSIGNEPVFSLCWDKQHVAPTLIHHPST